jgi:hypothetical protein
MMDLTDTIAHCGYSLSSHTKCDIKPQQLSRDLLITGSRLHDVYLI